MQSYWSWFGGGLALACCFLLAVTLVKPIGVSTQFVIADGVIWSLFDSELLQSSQDNKHGVASSNAYLNKSGGKYAAAIGNPINYGFIFVLAMIGGAFLGSRFSKGESEAKVEPSSSCALTQRPASQRYAMAFIGGAIVLFGARLAGGCTSGHMMSGMMQTSLSGYLFALAAFAAAVPTAILLYGRDM